MGIQGFSHVGICVTDLDRSTAFYRDVLGFSEVFTAEMGPEVVATMEVDGHFSSRMMTRGDLRVELLHWHDQPVQGDGARRPMTATGMTHLCFRVDHVDDLREVAARSGGAVHDTTLSVLEGVGVDGADVGLLYLTDPDGVRIECMSGTPAL